jgi:hypothetical protein
MRPRPHPVRRTLALLASALTLAALAALATQQAPAHAARATAAPQLSRQAFGDRWRMLWEDHIAWTRMAIVDFAAGLPSLPATEARLLRNQADIGNAIAPFYGQAAGRELTRLLRGHIVIAVRVLSAASAGDSTGLARAQRDWYANANGLAAFLGTANPRSWPTPAVRAMLHDHLALTTQEAVAQLTGKWSASVAAYDRIHRQALEMADMFADGIARQFPQRFRA